MSYRLVDGNELIWLEKDADLSRLPCIYVDNLPNGLDGQHYFTSQYNFTNEHFCVLFAETVKMEGLLDAGVMSQNVERILRKTLARLTKIVGDLSLSLDTEKGE